MEDCYGCAIEFSTNISEQLEFCNYCKRNDNQEFHEDKYELYMACNFKTCVHNKDGNCGSEECRKICVDVAKKVLCECNIVDDLQNPKPIDLNKIFKEHKMSIN